jgi:uncharacterized protein DUF1553/uncharacterized protein DUF1549/cytochrome c
MRMRALGLPAGATLLIATVGVHEAGPATSPPAEYAPVQAIFSARCVRCHGPEKQKGGLRLDTRTLALEGGVDGVVIDPGNSAESRLVRQILGEAKPRMPYREAPLDAGEIAAIRAWIDAGAPGPAEVKAEAPVPAPIQKHWAYVRAVRPELPAVKDAAWVKTPIDAFVRARLEQEGLAPSPEAAPETLLRRVTLDLTGLPPTPAEIDAFLADTAADAYEKVVDRLLASPHYGERWARLWLDLARYADTNGYEKDRRRAAWKWRDWVIAAFNADMPFRQFTVEQIAGDMLKDAGPDQRIASGFHRNTLLNQEGGIDVEEARWETLVDRVNTTATVWLGTTLACAQCHNHKFDPFTQKDYYRMLAFFDNAEYRVQGEGPKVTDRWIVEPELELATPAQAARKKSLEEEIGRVQARLDAMTPALTSAQAVWERERTAPPPAWITLQPTAARSTGGATLEVAEDGSVTVSGPNPDRDTYTLGARLPARPTTAFRIEALAEPPRGAPGRADYGAFLVTRLAVETAPRAGAPRSVPLVRAEADGDSRAAGLLDGDAETGWGGGDPDRSYAAVIRPDAPVGPGGRIVISIEHQGEQPRYNLRRFRLSVTSSPRPWGGLRLPEKIQAIVATPRPERSEAQRKELSDYYRGISPALEPERRKLRALRKELAALAIPTAMTLRERPAGERPSTPLRTRGAFTSPGERVYAAVPPALHPLPESAMPNRLGLALWLADDDNPLTPRVTVNRLWEQYFGHGLVETTEDFGAQGERPSHPELLDWLATEFLRLGTNLKPMHRLIVLSATYRQSSRVTPPLRDRDPYNRLLARGPRFRVEAEMVRDIALAASGLLSGKVGGPSVFPDQPEGIWDNPYSDDRWQMSYGEDRYRRALYTFARRTAPYPGLTVFDAPSREYCTARRVRTNTPLQALTALNDPAFFQAARALAARTLAEAAAAPEARAAHAFRLCTARRPSAPELAPLLAFEDEQLARFRADPKAARAVAGDAAPAEIAELAAWTMVANVLLNLDETLTKQ